MKYIRTKDGIYDLDKSIWYEFTGRKVRMPYCEEYEKQPELCKTANTIKELCDEFVGINDGKPQMLRFVPYACAQYWNGGVYGAIWTDKGLIYVAKMNKKGELELL